MSKIKIRLGPYLYPMPVVLVGAIVEEKANFMPIAWTCIVEHHPPSILISSSRTHHTNKGILEKGTFSINTPSEEMVVKADYCGLFTGRDTNKSDIFEVFYGDLKTAPLIRESPLNLECRLVNHFDYKNHIIFIGEIVQAYAEEACITNNIPDMEKMNPYVFSMNDNNYWKIGECIGKAWKIGKNYEK